jgi:hypothetical protein
VSGLLANLVGAATAALNLRSHEPAARAAAEGPREESFSSVLSAALGPRQRAERAARNDAPDAADSRADAGATDDTDAAADEVGIAPVAERAEARADDVTADAVPAGEAPAGEAAAAAAGATAPAARTEAAAGTKAETDAVDEASTTKAAAAEGPGPTPRSPTVVVRDLEALNAEFRARLDRVIERMETEHGHRVEVVETVRDQARQDHLYAQGRSRPGPVVTWTRSSNHTEGRAADLLVDGTYDNPLAMVRLARIAREEGLRTLGARDPGHVELPGGVRVESLTVAANSASSLLDGSAAKGLEVARAAVAQVAGRTDPAQPAVPQTVAAQAGGMVGPAGVARVARVAQVAQPAQVAQVATVARVATPGPIGGGRGVQAPQGVPQSTPGVVPDQLAASAGGGATGRENRGEDRSSQGEVLAEAFTESGRTAPSGAHPGLEMRGGGATEVRGAPAAFGAEAAERIARVLQLQDAAPARPLSQMVLRLDNPMGGEDRIRVDLRGGSVGAALNMGDAATAARIQAEIGQLQKALEGRGLQAEHLSVTSAVAGRELAEALRTALPSEGGRGSQQDPDARRENWNGRSGGRSADTGSENPRQRPRRDSQQERNT